MFLWLGWIHLILYSFKLSICFTWFAMFTLVGHRYQWGLSFFHASIRPSVRLSITKTRYRSNSLRISAIALKFGAMMHSTMKQIAVQNDCSRPIYARSTEIIGLGQVSGTTLPRLLQGFSYRTESGWDDVQYHEAYHCVKWPCPTILARSTELSNFQV